MSLRAQAGCFGLALLGLPFVLGAEEVAVLNAGSGSVVAPFVLTNGCVCQSRSREGGKGRAVYDFIVTNSGSFVLQCLVKAPGGDTNSLLVNVDAEPNDPGMTWNIPLTPGFTNRLISWRGESHPGSILVERKVFNLSPGRHQIVLRGDSGDVQLARISVLRIPAAPTGLRVTSGPGS
jgi:hypothetical protein